MPDNENNKGIDLANLQHFQKKEDEGIKVAHIGSGDNDLQAIQHALASHLISKQELSDFIILDDINKFRLDQTDNLDLLNAEVTKSNLFQTSAPIIKYSEPVKKSHNKNNRKHVKHKKAKNGRNKKK